MPVSATSAQSARRLMSADDALARILAAIPTLPAVDVRLLDALGLVLAEDVAADRDVPPFRNSAMDGYAVRGEDVARAPAKLRVVGEIVAGGTPARAIVTGEAMRIMTGAAMPEGADAVVPFEDSERIGSGPLERVRFVRPVRAGPPTPVHDCRRVHFLIVPPSVASSAVISSTG